MSDETQQEHQPVARNGGSRPIPDPTFLTDAAIAKAVAALTSYIDGEIKNIVTRIEGAVRLTDERFNAAEKLRIEQKKDTKDAVDAALSAAKEAVKEQTTSSERSIDKSEKATGEILKQQAESFAKAVEGLGDKLDDIKQRVVVLEATRVGATEQRGNANESRVAVYTTIGLIVSIILASVAVVGLIIKLAVG